MTIFTTIINKVYSIILFETKMSWLKIFVQDICSEHQAGKINKFESVIGCHEVNY